MTTSLTIPEHCGVMILRDCTVFPQGALPLYIFEPRYRQMLTDALEGDCMFAIGHGWREETPDPADCTAEVGTVCLIRVSREQPDGSSQLLLHGVFRVRFLEWLEKHPYPFARIAPLLSRIEPNDDAPGAVARLRSSVAHFAQKLSPDLRKAIEELMHRTEDPGTLSDIVSQQFIHEPRKRQKLLETESIVRRIDQLCELLPQIEI